MLSFIKRCIWPHRLASIALAHWRGAQPCKLGLVGLRILLILVNSPYSPRALVLRKLLPLLNTAIHQSQPWTQPHTSTYTHVHVYTAVHRPNKVPLDETKWERVMTETGSKLSSKGWNMTWQPQHDNTYMTLTMWQTYVSTDIVMVA